MCAPRLPPEEPQHRSGKERNEGVVIRAYFSMAPLSRSYFLDQQIHAHVHVQVFQRPRLTLQK